LPDLVLRSVSYCLVALLLQLDSTDIIIINIIIIIKLWSNAECEIRTILFASSQYGFIFCCKV